MDVDFDFSDVDSFFDEGEWEVVLSGAALHAEKRLKEEFEK